MSILFLLAVVTLAAPDRPDLTPKESRLPHEQIIGDWQYAGDGREAKPGAVIPNHVFRIMAGETVWITNGQPSPENGFTAKTTFDWLKNPVAIDMIPKRGGTPIRGIVRLEGDRLMLAWSNNDTRPADFAAGHHLHHFTRIKK